MVADFKSLDPCHYRFEYHYFSEIFTCSYFQLSRGKSVFLPGCSSVPLNIAQRDIRGLLPTIILKSIAGKSLKLEFQYWGKFHVYKGEVCRLGQMLSIFFFRHKLEILNMENRTISSYEPSL